MSQEFGDAPEFINRQIADYRILAKLGSGGMGTVYLAENTRLARQVALKLLTGDVQLDQDALERFRREIRTASSLNHPHICTVYDAGEDGGVPYLAMELLEGQTLAQMIAKKPLPIDTVLRLGSQICDALQCAHKKTIVHRDVKPTNIFITSRGDAKLFDFGLSKVLAKDALLSNEDATMSSAMTARGQLLGTISYMSPEQAQGKTLDARTDIFSFGAVLYEMSTGLRAFRGESNATILAEILRGEPTPPRALNTEVPAELQRIIGKALEKDPGDRYQSAKELMVDLRRLSKETTSAIGKPADVSVTKRPPHFQPRTVLLAIFAVLVAAFGIAIWLTPAPASGVLETRQITYSGEPKQPPLFTDGSRIYFRDNNQHVQMSVSGGSIFPMQTLESNMYIMDISADAAKALAWKPVAGDEIGRGSLWELSLLGGKPRQIGNYLAQSAAWFPDSRSFVFASQRALFRGDTDGDPPVPIWTAPGIVNELAVAPDGKTLTVTVTDDRTQTQRLWEVNVDTKSSRLQIPDWPNDSDHSSGRWSADGSHFVFLSNRDGRSNLYELVSPRWYEFWKKPLPVRVTANQVNILSAVPGRDNNTVFMLGRMAQGEMLAYDSRAKRMLPYLNGFPALEFVISPDRQWMAYTEYPSGSLWKSRLDGSDRTQLSASYAVMQQWSPDGKSIVYSDWKKLYLVSAEGGAPQKLISTGEHEVAPSWSPDGKFIYFNYYNFADQPLEGIQILDLADRQISLMPGSKGYYVPSWSPDGKYLVCIAQQPSRMMLYTAATKTWKELKRFDVPWGYWIWSNDSHAIYTALIAGENGMYRLTVPDGRWEKVSDITGMEAHALDSFVSLTPDGQPAMLTRTGVAQVYSLKWKH